MFLGRIANAAAPVLVPSRESVNLDNKVVVFPEEASAYDTEQYQALSEVEEESDNGSDDEDLAEGGEPNPEEEALITFGNFSMESMSNK